MKQSNLKEEVTPKKKYESILKEKKNFQNVSTFPAQGDIKRDQCVLSPELIKGKIDIEEQINNINSNINESLKQQMDSWKYTTFEADQFLLNTSNWIGRYKMFLQKVQEFYDHHPEIAKLTRENDSLKKDQNYFEEILNKYQKQADDWYDKLKNSLFLRNSLETTIKKKKKLASQLLIKRINLERVLDSKKALTEQIIEKSLKRARSNNTKGNEQSSETLLRSLSSKKRNPNLSDIITSTEASRNILSVNGSIQVGNILPSISPKAKGYFKQKSSFLFDSSSKKNQFTVNTSTSSGQKYLSNQYLQNSVQKIKRQSNLDQYLNSNIDQPSLKIGANDLAYLYKIGSMTRKERCITEIDVSPIIRNAKKQLETIDNLFKVPKPRGEYSLSSYKNLSYIKDKNREKQKRLLQNQSIVNQSLSTIGNDSGIGVDDMSSYKKQYQNMSFNKNKSLHEYQDSLSLIQQISKTKEQYSIQQIDSKDRIINDQSVIYLDQNEASSVLFCGESENDFIEKQELINIKQEIKKEKEEIKQKHKKIQELSRKFYRIEYFFEECLKCSEKTMMKKIENLQLNGFELNSQMENLLNVLDKFDDVGGVKQIVKKQHRSILSEQETHLNDENQSDFMEQADFISLSIKQLLFSICRSNQMKYYLTKNLKQKGEQIKVLVNEIKTLMSQTQFVQFNKIQKAQTDSIHIKNDFSYLESIQEKIQISNTSPTQRIKKKVYKFSSKNNL